MGGRGAKFGGGVVLVGEQGVVTKGGRKLRGVPKLEETLGTSQAVKSQWSKNGNVINLGKTTLQERVMAKNEMKLARQQVKERAAKNTLNKLKNK